MKHIFTKPYIFNEKEYTELEINIEDLSTADYEYAEKQFKMLNPNYRGVLETETGFIKQIICNAANVPLQFFDNLPAKEFINLKYAVTGFLLT